MTAHPLDRPVWNALSTRWSELAVVTPFARRLHPDYGPFAAPFDASAESGTALTALIPDGGEIWVVERPETSLPPCTATQTSHPIHQMVMTRLRSETTHSIIATLGEDDAKDMRALAHLTQPGPFHARTHLLGGFVGIKEDGRLIAMAGQRMLLDGHAEVSGVCTHPDHRGRGYAAALISHVAKAMIAREETPFLHSYAGNSGANALYESLGFRLRCRIMLTKMALEVK